MRSWALSMAPICLMLGLHGPAAGADCGVESPHAGWTYGAPQQPVSKMEGRSCHCLGCCARHVTVGQLLAPGAPPRGILVQSMPVMFPQLSVPTLGTPIQLPGTPQPYAPAPGKAEPGACSPATPGAGLFTADPVGTRVNELSASVAALTKNLDNLVKQQQKQIELLEAELKKK